MQTSHIAGNPSFKTQKFPNALISSSPEPQKNTGSIEKTVPDLPVLNQIKSEQAREFLHKHIARSMEDKSSKTPMPVPAYSRNFPDADSTASQIIAEVNQKGTPLQSAIGGKPESLESLINKIQKGFEEAKVALEKRDAFTGGFDTEFNDIQNQVSSFLDSLQKPEPKISTTEVMASSESYQTSSSASIQIETRDGDIVTIDLSSSLIEQQSNASINNNNFSGYVYEAYSEKSSSFAYTVSGELDESELEAISALVGDIAETVNQFEQGNVNNALNLSTNMNTQSGELSSFSFNVKTTEQYRAIDVYQKTQSNSVDTSQTTKKATSQNPAASGNIDNKVMDKIGNIMSFAESTNIYSASITVTNIFDKFYEQLTAKNDQDDHDEPKNEEREDKHVEEHA